MCFAVFFSEHFSRKNEYLAYMKVKKLSFSSCFVGGVGLPARGCGAHGGRFLGKNDYLALWTASWNASGIQKVSVSYRKMSVLWGELDVHSAGRRAHGALS